MYSKSETYNTLDYFIVKHGFYRFSKPFDFVYKGWQMLYEWDRVDLQILEWTLTRVKLRGFIEIDVFAFQLRMTTTVKD